MYANEGSTRHHGERADAFHTILVKVASHVALLILLASHVDEHLRPACEKASI